MGAQRKSVADNELLIVRTFNAPPSVVFALWSNAEHMKRWMGPNGFSCTEMAIDLRVGGRYRGMIKSADHGENWFGGVYREIVPDQRLVFTFIWENEGPSAGREMVVTITFEARDGKTVQTFHQAPFRTVERRDSHVGGWSQAFDKQATYAEKIAKEQAA
jgi:uncharacterized protein YndB with AHSA1/START domain